MPLMLVVPETGGLAHTGTWLTTGGAPPNVKNSPGANRSNVAR